MSWRRYGKIAAFMLDLLCVALVFGLIFTILAL